MIIYGERIALRAIKPDDNQMLLDLINDPETEQMIGGMSQPISMEDQMKWFAAQVHSPSVLRCIVACKENDAPLGTIVLSEIDHKNGTAHIHIKMSKNEARGKGYGTDALQTMVSYAFSELRLNCIFANILSYNVASKRLFEKCGFKQEGVLRQRIYKLGQFNDVLVYSKLQTD